MILLDTHILVWLGLAPEKISDVARDAIENSALFIADITFWEIAMLVQKDRISIDTDCQVFLQLLVQAYDLTVLPITPEIAMGSTQLGATINKDPADRLIVATALNHDLPLVTADQNLNESQIVVTIW